MVLVLRGTLVCGEIQLAHAVGAVGQPGEQPPLARLGGAALVGKHLPFLRGEIQHLFGLVRLLAGLEVHRTAQVLHALQDFYHCPVVPAAGVRCRLMGDGQALFQLVRRGRQHPRRFQPLGDLHRPQASHAKAEYLPHHLGRFLVHFPFVLVSFVAIGDLGTQPLSAVALAGEHRPYLLGGITGVKLVEQFPHRRHIVQALGAVDVVRNGDIPHPVVLCEPLHESAHQKAVAAQSGMVLDDDGRYPSPFHKVHHLPEAGAVKVRPGVAVIGEVPHIREMVFLAVFPQEIPLIDHRTAVTLQLVLLAQTVIASRDIPLGGECAGNKFTVDCIVLPHSFNLL